MDTVQTSDERTCAALELDVYKRQVLLCFTLFKSGSVAKGIFGAH